MGNAITKASDSAPREVAAEYGLGVLKGAVGAVPWIGGVLNEMLFEARSRLRQDRLNTFFGAVAERVEQLGEEKIDKAFVRTEAFSDLVENVCIRVSQTHGQERRTRFRDILVGAVQGRHDPDFAELFIGLVATMSDSEVMVLQRYEGYIRAKQKRPADAPPLELPPINYASFAGLSEKECRQVVQSLISRGLMFDDSFGRLSTLPYTIVAPTDLAERFLAWLRGGS